MRAHPVRAAVAAAFVGLVALFAAESALVLIDLRSGQRQLSRLDLESIAREGELERPVAGAARRLHAAADRSRTGLSYRVLGALPVLGSQVDAVRELTGAVDELGRAAVDAARSLDAAIDEAGSEPRARVTLMATAGDEIAELQRVVDGIDLGSGWVVPPLDAARDQLADRLGEAEADLAEAEEWAGAMHTFLRGPGKYLLLAANNAEMTAGSGMPLAAGIARIDDGEIELDDFVQINELPRGTRGVAIPEDLDRLYARMGLGFDLRGTTTSPNYPVVAEIAARMVERGAVGRVDGVFVVDAFTLAAILRVTGPVEVQGLELDGRNVVAEILHRNYVRYPRPEDRVGRADLQAAVARAAFDALTTRPISATRLAVGLTRAAEGRHLLAWSRDDALQEVWSQLDVAGELDPRGLGIFVQNADGNKLDWFLRPHARITPTELPDGRWHVRIDVSVRYPPLRGQPPYVVGVDAAEHWVLLDVHAPAAATDFKLRAGPGERPHHRARGSDPPMKVINTIYPITRGDARTATVTFILPEGHTELTLLPGARVVPLTVDLPHVELDDAIARPFNLVPPPADDVPLHVPVSAAIALATTARLQLRARRRGAAAMTFDDLPTWIGFGLGLAVLGFGALLSLAA